LIGAQLGNTRDLSTAFLLPLRDKVAAKPTDEGYFGDISCIVSNLVKQRRYPALFTPLPTSPARGEVLIAFIERLVSHMHDATPSPLRGGLGRG
jgi:hypothetical protein